MPGEVALRLEVLPASYGDCLVVSVPDQFTLVIDTGPSKETLERLRSRLRQLPERDGRRRIDLFVITHIDADHIARAADLLEDETWEFGDVWFNGLDEVLAVRGSNQADAVSEVLRRKGLPHNLAFGGGPVVVPEGPARWLEVTGLSPHAPTITLLSPRTLQLEALAQEWPETVRRFAAGEPDSASEETRGGDRSHRPTIDLARLVEPGYDEDDSRPNASSIAFLVEHHGASLLLTGDGISSVYGRALAGLLASRPADRRRVDAVKLAHHGSRRNTEGQLTIAGARHYLVSSNNRRYGLPDDETIARLVHENTAAPVVWFNYDTPLNARWREVAAASGTFEVRYPTDPEVGAVLELPTRST